MPTVPAVAVAMSACSLPLVNITCYDWGAQRGPNFFFAITARLGPRYFFYFCVCVFLNYLTESGLWIVHVVRANLHTGHLAELHHAGHVPALCG